MTIDRVDQSLLLVARTYEGGRHYGLVKWLIDMGDDGDIIWLLSKGMTAADVGQKNEDPVGGIQASGCGAETF